MLQSLDDSSERGNQEACHSGLLLPPGKAINDGIPKTSYLEFETEFSLPSVRSMVDRLNSLGTGCLMFKRDLKGAFR